MSCPEHPLLMSGALAPSPIPPCTSFRGLGPGYLLPICTYLLLYRRAPPFRSPTVSSILFYSYHESTLLVHAFHPSLLTPQPQRKTQRIPLVRLLLLIAIGVTKGSNPEKLWSQKGGECLQNPLNTTPGRVAHEEESGLPKVLRLRPSRRRRERAFISQPAVRRSARD
jgi:hypothetical protein